MAAITRRRDEAEARRAQILNQAIGMIGERGYYGFRIQELADRCRLTSGGVLYHFATKEELFLAVVGEFERRVEAGLIGLIQSFPEGDADWNAESLSLPRPSLLRLLRDMVEQSTTSAPELSRLFAVMQAEAVNSAHPGHAYFRDLEVRIRDGLQRVVAPHCTEPAQTANQVFALMHGLEHIWHWTHGTFDILDEWDRAIEKILPEKKEKGV